MPATELTKVVDRCRKAYEANGIAWDYGIGQCSIRTLEHLAECWEKRAAGLPVDEGFLDAKAAKAKTRRLNKNWHSFGPRQAPNTVFTQVWREYHGA